MCQTVTHVTLVTLALVPILFAIVILFPFFIRFLSFACLGFHLILRLLLNLL